MKVLGFFYLFFTVDEVGVRFRFKVFRSRYWRPGYDFYGEVSSRVSRYVENGDYLVVSEKAVAVALGYIVDEAKVNPSLSAKILARIWVPLIWGYLLGVVCHLKPETLVKLRCYPYLEGARHKEAALRYVGPVAALKHFSEGGLDVNNLPYSYAALPLPREVAVEVASRIRREIAGRSGRRITVILSDSDHTFSWRGVHLASRSTVKGVRNLSTLGFVLGAFLKWKARPTPTAISGFYGSLDEVLEVCRVAEKARGYGLGRDIWESSARMGVSLTGLTWRMMDRCVHTPYVLIRKA